MEQNKIKNNLINNNSIKKLSNFTRRVGINSTDRGRIYISNKKNDFNFTSDDEMQKIIKNINKNYPILSSSNTNKIKRIKKTIQLIYILIEMNILLVKRKNIEKK